MFNNEELLEAVESNQEPETPQIEPEVIETTQEEPIKLTLEEHRRLKQEARSKLAPEDQKYWEMGWRPKELFSGKNRDGSPKQWVPLEQFKEIIEKNPRVKAEREKALEEKMERLQQNVERVSKLNQLKLEREHKTLEEKINYKLKEAEELGDLQAYKEALKDKQFIEQEKAEWEKINTPAQPQVDPTVQYEIDDFRRRNPWYDQDKILQSATLEQLKFINTTRPELDIKRKLELAEQMIKTAYSEKFPSQPIRNIPMPDTSRNSGAMTPKPPISTKIDFYKLSENEQRQVEQLAKMKRMTRDEVITKYYKK